MEVSRPPLRACRIINIITAKPVDSIQIESQNKDCRTGKIQFFCGKSRDEKSGQRYHDSHGERIAAGQPLPGGHADAEVLDDRRERRRQRGGKQRRCDAVYEKIHKNESSF